MKHFRHFLFLGLLICMGFAGTLKAQYFNKQSNYLKANRVWAFGTNAGLDFNSGGPVGIQTQLSNVEGATAVADPVTGRLLFYSDGWKCWDSTHQVMPNGDSLLGNGSTGSTTQGVCIVPVIDSAGKYYLFSLNYQGTIPALYYSIVDMSLNSGRGDIVAGRKNIILDNSPLSEGMIAIPGNNCDLWLVVHESQNPVFRAYHITRDGVSDKPVNSNTGKMAGPGAYYVGSLAVSPDRSKIAIGSYNCPAGALPEEMGILLAKFDAGTGTATDGIRLMEEGIYGVCFSPDNSKLYGHALDANLLYQFDVKVHDSTTVAASRVIIPGSPDATPYLRLYNDTIYLSHLNQNTLCRIVQPNLAGAACGFQVGAVNLAAGTSSMYNLGSDIVYALPPDTAKQRALDTLICTSNEEGTFEKPLILKASTGYYAYEWNDTTTDPEKVISKPGTYWVLSKDLCHSRIDTFHVKQVNVFFSLGNDTTLCDQAYFVLRVPIPDAEYIWSDGSTDSTLTVRESGEYFVKVRMDGCSASDTITVYAKSFIQDLGNDTTFCKSDPLQKTLWANVPSGAKVLWNTGSEEESITVQDSGSYWVKVWEYSCLGTDTIRVDKEICTCSFEMPNAFTPNGDGLNDFFLPVIETGCPTQNYMFNVYNRYGERIFANVDPTLGWDGYYKGQPADAGSYYYEIKFDGGTYKKPYYQKGDLLLVR